jgi:polysaccharide export outer membrane protein
MTDPEDACPHGRHPLFAVGSFAMEKLPEPRAQGRIQGPHPYAKLRLFKWYPMKTAAPFAKVSFAIIAVLISTLGLAQSPASQATSNLPQAAAANSSAAHSNPAGYEPLIGIGDLLKISVLGVTDYDQQLRVGGDGDAFLALAGSVHVAGLTTEQAQQLIRKRLMDGGYFADPQVSVFEQEFATQGVSVLGEVQKPGVYPLTGPRRLFDVLSLAGGTTPKAGQVVSISHRNEPKSLRTVALSNDPGTNIEADVEILPGDTVVVTKAGIVYVVGAVKTSTGIVLENSGGITVLQAIATAGGTNPMAALNGTKIIRKSPTGPVEIPIQLKKILAAKSPDVKLEAEDILFVPSSAGKTAAGMALDAGLRLATTVAAYAVIY